MVSLLILTNTLCIATIGMSIIIIKSLLKIKETGVPFCLSWLGRGLVSNSFAAIFFVIWCFTKTPWSLLMTEYLTLTSLYLYALWQTKFTLYKSKSFQKTYILVLNVLLTLLGYKYILRLSTEAFELPITNHTQTFAVSFVIIILFFLMYLLYCLSNRHNEFSEVRKTVHCLYWTLGIMIVWDIVQLLLSIVVTKLPNGGIATVADQQYHVYFVIDTLVKLFLNLIYMYIVQVQVDVDKGRFMSDTLEAKDAIK